MNVNESGRNREPGAIQNRSVRGRLHLPASRYLSRAQQDTSMKGPAARPIEHLPVAEENIARHLDRHRQGCTARQARAYHAATSRKPLVMRDCNTPCAATGRRP